MTKTKTKVQGVVDLLVIEAEVIEVSCIHTSNVFVFVVSNLCIFQILIHATRVFYYYT